MNATTPPGRAARLLDPGYMQELSKLLIEQRELGTRAGQMAEKLAAASMDWTSPFQSKSLLDRAKWLQKAMDVRETAFGERASMFGDPGFDILLLIYIRSEEGRQTSVTAATNAGNAKSTTGLRWVHALVARGLIKRHDDPGDRRRGLVSTSANGKAAVERYLDMLNF